jgi:hypothetical protein
VISPVTPFLKYCTPMRSVRTVIFLDRNCP